MIKQHKNELIFFVDRALGKNLVLVLRRHGAKIEAHNDHFPPNTPDVIWLADVSQKGWVVLTKDARIARNPEEVRTIAQSNAQVFILAAGDASGNDIADTFIEALPNIESFIKGNKSPFIARVYKNGKVELWQSSTKLKKLIQMKG